MGRKQITANGQQYELDENATVADLKARMGAAETDIGTYTEGDGTWVTVSDRDPVSEIPDGVAMAFQPGDTVFGRNKHCLLQEIAALQRKYTVRYNLDTGIVDLVRVKYPPSWSPRYGQIRFATPQDYNASPPTVHIPAEMAYKGDRNIIRKKPSQFDGWNRWCARYNGWDPSWHTLVSVSREMMISLRDPSKRRLFTARPRP